MFYFAKQFDQSLILKLSSLCSVFTRILGLSSPLGAKILIYVNDLPSCQLASEIILYADDTVIYYSSTNLFDLESSTISNWFSSNLLILNISKCNFVIFGNSRKLKLVDDVNSTAREDEVPHPLLSTAVDPLQKWLPLNYSFVHIQNSLTNLVFDTKNSKELLSRARLVRLFWIWTK